MINILSLSFRPSTACWVHPRGQARSLLAVTEEGSHIIRIYDGRGTNEPVMTVEKVHRAGSSVEILAVIRIYLNQHIREALKLNV